MDLDPEKDEAIEEYLRICIATHDRLFNNGDLKDLFGTDEPDASGQE